MVKKDNILLLIAVIALLPLLGYGLTYGLNIAAPMSEGGMSYHVLFILLIIVMGLGVPYWMMKLLSRAAHVQNPQEKEFQLSDLPKDKDDSDKVM